MLSQVRATYTKAQGMDCGHSSELGVCIREHPFPPESDPGAPGVGCLNELNQLAEHL